MENAFPQKPFGWPWAFRRVPALRVRLCARALALARSGLAGFGDFDHVRLIQPVAGPGRPYAPRRLELTTNGFGGNAFGSGPISQLHL